MNFNISTYALFSKQLLVLLISLTLAACGQNPPVKTVKKPLVDPIATVTPDTPVTAKPTPNVLSPEPAKPESKPEPESKPGSGGYYLDDGPGDNAPANIDNIPGAVLKSEQPSKRANKPYSALGQQYTPMTNFVPYKKTGMASWYGKRFHGKKTSTGEIYDMYAMSAAHTILPIPSYAKVTNIANGRSVIVRINDRGPFKRARLIDLSYAAAYQLRLIKQGSGMVEVETIDTSPEALSKITTAPSIQTASASAIQPFESLPPSNSPALTQTVSLESKPSVTLITSNTIASSSIIQFYVQAGAFKSEANGDLLQKKIQSLALDENIGVANVYNNGLYRVKLGPYANKSDADVSAANIRKQLNITVHVTN